MKVSQELEQQILAMPGVVVSGGPARPEAEPMSEKDFMAAVVKRAKELGWKSYHTHDSRKSERGFPDLVLVRDRVLFAEFKTEIGQVTPDQEVWLDRLRDAGAEAYLWRPANWPEIEKALA